jgi:hypothetical protein
VLGGRDLSQLRQGYVMVRQNQSARADEGTGTAVIEADTGQADVVKPCRSGCETIMLLELLQGKIIKCPHAFVGMNPRYVKQHEPSYRNEKEKYQSSQRSTVHSASSL